MLSNVFSQTKIVKSVFCQDDKSTLTPTGWRATKYFPGVFVVSVQHESLGQRQFAFIRVEADERRFAAIVHFPFRR